MERKGEAPSQVLAPQHTRANIKVRESISDGERFSSPDYVDSPGEVFVIFNLNLAKYISPSKSEDQYVCIGVTIFKCY